AATKEEVRAEQEAVARLVAELRDRHEPAVRSAEAELRAALEPFAAFGATAADVARALEDERRAQLARLAKRLTAVTGGRDFDALLAETTGELERPDAAVEAARPRRRGRGWRPPTQRWRPRTPRSERPRRGRGPRGRAWRRPRPTSPRPCRPRGSPRRPKRSPRCSTPPRRNACARSSRGTRRAAPR